MDRVDPKGAALDEQDHEAAGTGRGGSVPHADGGGDGGADALPGGAAPDKAAGAASGREGGGASGGEGGGAGGGDGTKVTDIKDLMEVAEVRDWLHSCEAVTVGLLKASVIRFYGKDGDDIDDAGDPVDWKGGRYRKSLVDIHFKRTADNAIVDIVIVPGFGQEAADAAARCVLDEDEKQRLLAVLKRYRLPLLKMLEVSNANLANDPSIVALPNDSQSESKERRQLAMLKQALQRPSQALRCYIYRTPDDAAIHMIRVRKDVVTEERVGKVLLTFTYWSDDQWRVQEPDGLLPLYGVEQLGDPDKPRKVALHEGEKAAHRMRTMVEAAEQAMKKNAEARSPQMQRALKTLAEHPWGREMLGYVHVGWGAGASNVHRVDWSALNSDAVSEVVIFADNDKDGINAVPHIAERLHKMTRAAIFTQAKDWDQQQRDPMILPNSFDLGDDFPEKMFCDGIYIGPLLDAFLEYATWATNSRPRPGGGRPIVTLREHFAERWTYLKDELERLVCADDKPELPRTAANVNKMMSRYAHPRADVASMLINAIAARPGRLAYLPGQHTGPATLRDEKVFNQWRPSPWSVRAGRARGPAADASFIIEYFDRMFPVEAERNDVIRFCATLVAKPEVRMHYGMLLVSDTKGVGKSTLAEAVLGPLVGMHNVGLPSVHDILDSKFTDWIAQKTLVFIEEVNEAGNWRLVNALKKHATSKSIRVDVKGDKPYNIENRAHFIACSNSLHALAMEDGERRWHYPEVTEEAWPLAGSKLFHAKMKQDGLQVCADFFARIEEIGLRYVEEGERAPMTARKAAAIEQSRGKTINEIRGFWLQHKDEEFGMSPKQVRDRALRIEGGEGKHSDAVPSTRTISEEMQKQAIGMKPLALVLGRELRFKWNGANGVWEEHSVHLSRSAAAKVVAMATEQERREYLTALMNRTKGLLEAWETM